MLPIGDNYRGSTGGQEDSDDDEEYDGNDVHQTIGSRFSATFSVPKKSKPTKSMPESSFRRSTSERRDSHRPDYDENVMRIRAMVRERSAARRMAIDDDDDSAVTRPERTPPPAMVRPMGRLPTAQRCRPAIAITRWRVVWGSERDRGPEHWYAGSTSSSPTPAKSSARHGSRMSRTTPRVTTERGAMAAMPSPQAAEARAARRRRR